MYFFLQSLSAQSNCAHMQFLHEAVDTTKCWEKSPPSTPLLYITISAWDFLIRGQCEQVCWTRRLGCQTADIWYRGDYKRIVTYSGPFMLQRHSVQHRQGTQTRLNNGRYPINITCVSTVEHIEISANTDWFTVCIEDQVEPYQNIPHPANVRKKLISPKKLRLNNCGLWFIKHGEDMSVVTEEDWAKMHDTTGDTPPVNEDGPAPRPCKF